MKKQQIRKTSFITALIMALCLTVAMATACGGAASIMLDKTEAKLFVGDSVKIIATVTGKEDADVEWSSDNTKVATVRRGTVQAVAKGTATITAKLESGEQATCAVTVDERTVSISAETATINLDENKTFTLTATASDGGAITWNTSDPAVATVDGGVVTGVDVGSAIITAQRGTAKAECKVTVIEPSRPADYYVITKLTNAECVADPGKWHYHADGSLGSTYGFEKEPLHRDATASATLNVVPNPDNSQYFYFRYQPDQVKIGEYYTITVEVTVSSACELRLASKRSDSKTPASYTPSVNANEATMLSYVGYLNEVEPFSVRINSKIEEETVTISVKLIKVEANDGTNLPDYHTETEDKPTINYEVIPASTEAYNIEAKTNSETLNNPGTWYYNKGDGSEISEVKYNNGSMTFNFTTLKNKGNNQLRFRPEGLTEKTNIKVTFTVASNVDAKVVLALCNTTNYASVGAVQNKVLANKTVDFEMEVSLDTMHVIFIEVNSVDESVANAEVTFTNVKIYKEVKGATGGGEETPTPGGETYEIEAKNNSGTMANPGKWFYFCDGAAGTDYELASAPAMNNGTITFAFNKMAEGSPAYQLRFQPKFAEGSTYTVTFKVTLSAAGKVVYGTDYKAKELAAGETATVTWTGTVQAASTNKPFLIQFRSTDRSAPITMTVSEIVFTQA